VKHGPDTHSPRSTAVALAYHAGESAPQVVAKGQGVIAQEIIARARSAGVYVHESPELVSLLMQVNLDERIPPALYVAIAELLAWLYQMEQGGSPPPPLVPGV
jgi:flagellar biosynthesis protein